MTEEEKKAIEYLEENIEFFKTTLKRWDCNEDIKQLETILNLIEKQQKEIEELKNIKCCIKKLQEDSMPSDTYIVIAENNFLQGTYKKLLNDYIPKSKMEEKIEELEAMSISEEIYYDDVVKMFKELLESDTEREE